MENHLSEEIKKIQQTVVGMYSEHSWPMGRNAEEEMGWRLKCLGIVLEDYQGKKILDLGCGTGEYAFWYAMKGAGKVVGVDLSESSLALAQRRKEEEKFDNIEFVKKDILNLDFPDNMFDYSFSVGALHHTGDPFRGFRQLVRVTKPGGILVVSLYNSYSRQILRLKQSLCKWLGGEDIDKRVEWGERLFGRTLKKIDKRYHGLNTKQIAYDIFGFPHESLHSAGEVLEWFKETNVRYKGSFAPLRIRDYFYAFSQPEYFSFRSTFSGFPVMQRVTDLMTSVVKLLGKSKETIHNFPTPNPFSAWVCQMGWILFGLRFNCFTISGTKLG